MSIRLLLVLLACSAALVPAYLHPAHVHPTAAPPKPFFAYSGCPVTEVSSSEQLHDILATDQPVLVAFYSDRT
jgi:hypothetical protein